MTTVSEMFKDEDELYDFLEKVQVIQEEAANIATAMHKLSSDRNRFFSSFDSDDISFEYGGYINAEYTYHDRCGDSETYRESIPLSHFFDSSWYDEALQQIEKEKEKERLRKEMEDITRKRKAEEAERKKYEELKAKFENK